MFHRNFYFMVWKDFLSQNRKNNNNNNNNNNNKSLCYT